MKPGEILKRPLLSILLLASLGILILPYILSSYYMGLVIQIFVMAIFAASLDILVGHTGLPSMGHASYFGVAGYAAAFLVLSGVKSFWIVMAVAVASKCPLSNKTWTMGVLRKINPIMAGKLMKETSRSVKETVRPNSSILPWLANPDKLGKDAIPTAIAKIPRGNSISRSAKKR